MPEQFSRGDLPHWYVPGHAHFVTYRLTNSLPSAALEELRIERDRQLRSIRKLGSERAEALRNMHKRLFARYDEYLDTRLDDCWLKEAAVANIMRENLYHHHQKKYELIAYCVMPNHMHVVFQPFESSITRSMESVADVFEVSGFGCESLDSRCVLGGMHSLKSYTANRANELLGRAGTFWQRESYDHWIRSIDELERIIAYVAANPVKAGLCKRPCDWQFSSAYDRYQLDRSECAYISSLQDNWRR